MDSSEPDYQDEWEQLDEKVLLASILAEQQRTNQLLAKLAGEDTDTPDAEKEATPMYSCDFCDAEVPKDKRERHADGHSVPPGDWEAAFTRVEP